MRWVMGTFVTAGVLSASIALGAAGQANQAGSTGKAEQADRQARRNRVVVTPQIEVFQADRAQLGVALRDLDDTLAKEHRLASVDGDLVERVEPGSAAEKAGIKPGDVITSFDGERVRSVRHLQRLVGDTPADRAVKIGLLRDGRKVDVTATLTKAEGPLALAGSDNLERYFDRLQDLPRAFQYQWRGDEAPLSQMPRFRTPQPLLPQEQAPAGAGRLGVMVQELTPQLGEYFGAKDGVLVASVNAGSAAEKAGVKAGDVITSVNGKAVSDSGSLVRLLREQPGSEEVSLGILRDHKAQTLKVKLLNAARTRPI
jgi:serine protease Do